MKKYIIEETENKRIDKYICNENKDISRTAVQRLITSGKVLVNGEKVKPSYILNNSDVITIEEEIAEEIVIQPQEIPLDIIYQDDDILIINKEKGMVVHPREWQ